MAKKEVKIDLWVAAQLDECKIRFDAQGSDVKEINEALKTASKRGTGNAGYPEYTAVIGDFVLVIEDKADMDKQVKWTDSGIIDTSVKAVTDYAVNGAYFYAKHIAQNTTFKKVFAVGVSGDAKHHIITPLWVDDREGYKQLPDIESFVSFSEQNINEYYTRYVLEEATDIEKTTEQILKDAAELHEYLRTYGTLKDQDKPLVVAGILLALDEIEFGGFSINSLTGDQTPGMRDGDKLMNAVKGRLTRSNVGPDAKKDKLLAEFAILQTSFRLNEVNETLKKTPLKYYTEFLYEHVFRNIKYQKTSEDFIGRFYGEFMSYSGGDGQTLGIILTPRHICDLMCELVDVQPNDTVLDPTCGTAGFLISAMHRMLMMADTDAQKKNIKKKQLHICRQCTCDLQKSLLAIRKIFCQLICKSFQIKQLQKIHRLLLCLCLFLPEKRCSEDGLEQIAFHILIKSNHNIFQNGHFLEKADILEGSGNSRLNHLMRGQPVHPSATQHIASRGRFINTGDQVKNGCFACTVRSDQTDQLTGIDFNIHIIDCFQTTKLDPKAFCLKHRNSFFCHTSHLFSFGVFFLIILSISFGRENSRPPNRPVGLKIITTTKMIA